MGRKKEMAIYNRWRVDIEGGRFVEKIERCEVRVMARAEGYAMVRRPGCIPFAVREKDLEMPQSLGLAGGSHAP
jgi:hypothetical protein